jgi:DNA-binding transcriptional MerR regulator
MSSSYREMKPTITKLYYSIGEVSELTGLEAHVLRFWESEFPELRPRKNRAGRRVYTEDDIRVVERIQQLLRDDRYTIEGARHVLSLESEGPGLEARRRSLVQLRELLVAMRDGGEEPGGPDPSE